MKVTSADNPAVKLAVRLRDQRERRATGRFLIEGEREIAAAVSGGIEIETIFRAPDATTDAPGARILDAGDAVLGKIGYRGGSVAVAHTFDLALRDPPSGPLTVLVADRIEKPGNLGAMLRTADATGAWVLVADAVVDVFNPNVVRASVGTLFTGRVSAGTGEEIRAWLRTHGISLVAASPAGETALWDWRAPERCAVVIGAEDTGVGDDWLAAADHRVAIPMQGAADSLNAATSAAIVLYEIARARAAHA